MRRYNKNTMFCLIMLFMAFCPPKLSAQEPSAKNDVVYFATTNGNYRVAFEKITADYKKLHPNIDVKVDFISLEGFETWIRSRYAAGGELIPDIYNSSYCTGYDREGKWTKLNKYLDSINPYTGKKWRDTFDMTVLDRYTYAGGYYQLAVDYVDVALFYNKDIFDKLGLTPPKTWSELIEICGIIKRAGYVPISTAGNVDSFWMAGIGLLMRFFGDAYLRNYVEYTMSRPGDWDYDPQRNDNYKYDPNDLYSDRLVVVNAERVLNAIREGVIDFRSERCKQIYRRTKELSRYFQEGYMGSDYTGATQMFYKQKAAISLLVSSMVTQIKADFQGMEPNDRFNFGIFWFPTIKDPNDKYICGPFRGIGGAGSALAVSKKDDPEHEKNVIDFFMYMTTPQSGQIIVDKTLADNQILIGPPLITGVKLPQDLAGKFEPFMGHGFEKINFRGLMDEQESVGEWTVIAQEFFADRISLDDFCEKYHQLMLNAIPRLQEKYGFDLDPATKDEPPNISIVKNKFNPFENGSLMLFIVVCLFGGFAAYHIVSAKGASRSKTQAAYLFLLPIFFLLGIFNYYPALSGLYHAFTRWEGRSAAVFIGFDNFRKLAGDIVFYKGIWNMVFLVLAGLFKMVVIPFITAEIILLITSDKLKYFFRTAFLIPMVMPGMVIILIWRLIYDPNAGLLNQALTSIGFEKLTSCWLGEPKTALAAIAFMGFPWIGAFPLLIYMAGLMHIPSSVYEAYQLESTSWLKRIFTIDIPLVKGQTKMLMILTFISTIQDFQTILIMTQGGPGISTYVPALRMYVEAFKYDHFGYGAAIGLVLFLVILIITAINMKVLKAEEME